MSSDDYLIVQKAQALAMELYLRSGQTRKFTGAPYWIHPREVALYVQSVRHTPAMIAAAWCHDLVEDGLSSLELLCNHLSLEVANLVAELSTPKHPGNRAMRIAAEVQRLRSISADAQTIKLADILSNTADVATLNPSFAGTYLPEKREQIEVLRQGNFTLWAMARVQVRNALDRVSSPPRHGTADESRPCDSPLFH